MHVCTVLIAVDNMHSLIAVAIAVIMSCLCGHFRNIDKTMFDYFQ